MRPSAATPLFDFDADEMDRLLAKFPDEPDEKLR
jgi:hypothetical protein